MGRTAVLYSTMTSSDFKLFSVQNQNNNIKKSEYSTNNGGNMSVKLNNAKGLRSDPLNNN
jgi:hypothetical protein